MSGLVSVWFERSFPANIPPELAPNLNERLRGTPVRLAERLSIAPERLSQRPAPDKWSIQEHGGHLGDLENLWLTRFREFRQGVETLRAADLANRKTFAANHNQVHLSDILADFRRERVDLLSFLTDCRPDYFRLTACHPRLEQQMTPVDLMYFVAEHDDHHLAKISELLRDSS